MYEIHDPFSFQVRYWISRRETRQMPDVAYSAIRGPFTCNFSTNFHHVNKRHRVYPSAMLQIAYANRICLPDGAIFSAVSASHKLRMCCFVCLVNSWLCRHVQFLAVAPGELSIRHFEKCIYVASQCAIQMSRKFAHCERRCILRWSFIRLVLSFCIFVDML